MEDRAGPETDGWVDGRASGVPGSSGGRALGDIVHSALEKADFGTAAEAEALRLCPGGGDDPRQAREMVRKVLESPLAEEIRTSTEVRREVPFYLPLESGSETDKTREQGPAPAILHGIMDLIFRDGNGRWVVVDWKTNAIHDQRRLALLLAQHAPQVQLYAAALHRIDGISGVDRGALLYLARNLRRDGMQLVDVSEGARAEALGRAAEAARRIMAGDYRTKAGPKCANCGYRRFGWCEVGLGWAG
jgi:CRISPR/Cas system-associated exonuclease Cas4 (RecB family)